MGSAIIDAISSGLGLIQKLAENFLSGFEALFVKTGTEGAVTGITNFGTFAFIMLGLAVAFGCIKLACRLVRGNTGI